MRIIIVGNSGSGKTWLANRLSAVYSTPVIHFDDIFWEPGGFDQKRDPGRILSLINESKNMSSWIAEGVFGNIAEHYIEKANTFIWLDIPLETCLARLKIRGSENKKQMNREQSKQGLKDLMVWASHYYDRKNLNSYPGHRQLFTDFTKEKFLLCSESDVHKFLRIQQRDGDGPRHVGP